MLGGTSNLVNEQRSTAAEDESELAGEYWGKIALKTSLDNKIYHKDIVIMRCALSISPTDHRTSETCTITPST